MRMSKVSAAVRVCLRRGAGLHRAAAVSVAALGFGAAVAVAPVALATPDSASVQTFEDEASARLRRWLQTNGCNVGGMHFGYCPGNNGKGRGAFIEQHTGINSSDAQPSLLLHLPAELVLTAERAMESVPQLRTLRDLTRGDGTALASALGRTAATDALLLTVFVLLARVLRTPAFADYVAALPKNFDSPTVWSDKSPAEACLEGTPLGAAVAAKRRWLHTLASNLPQTLRDAGMPDAALALEAVDQRCAEGGEGDGGLLRLIRWADAVVWSRGLGLPRAEGGSQMCLLPGIDMVNHAEAGTEIAGWVPLMSGGVELHRRVQAAVVENKQHAIGAGAQWQEVTISYGDKVSENSTPPRTRL